ncbi:MAG: nuclear transport factor 2 family protein [Novosphingobium sp.]
MKHLKLAVLAVAAGLLATTAVWSRQPGPTAPEAVARSLYAAFEAGDMDKILSLIDEDAAWTYHGPPSLPFAGTRRGPEGVKDFFAKVDQTLTDAKAGQTEFLVAGDTVIVPGYEASTVKATGVHYNVKNVHVFKIRGGKIIQFDEYIDSGTVLEAFMPASPSRGRAAFTTCAGCHGNNAEGRAEMFAPALTGQDPAYLIRQLANFREGRRGKVEDNHAFQMVGRASVIPGGERGVRDVVAYITTLPAGPAPAGLSAGAAPADAQACTACHGASGEGNPKLAAPALRGLSQQYIAAQLHNFRKGLRGYASNDANGQVMKAAAAALPDDRAVQQVATYYGMRR